MPRAALPPDSTTCSFPKAVPAPTDHCAPSPRGPGSVCRPPGPRVPGVPHHSAHSSRLAPDSAGLPGGQAMKVPGTDKLTRAARAILVPQEGARNTSVHSRSRPLTWLLLLLKSSLNATRHWSLCLRVYRRGSFHEKVGGFCDTFLDIINSPV